MTTDPNIPPRLGDALRGLYRTPEIGVAPPDESILELCRQRAHLARRRRLVWVTRAGLVAAAGLAVGAFIMLQVAGPTPSAPIANARDVNRDGRVDILDALVVAQAVRSGNAAAAWDFSGDGRLNETDVDLIAQEAVRLTPAGGARQG